MVKNSTEQQQRRPTPASWRPGQSGNPRGRPPKGSALTDAIRDKVDTAELVDIALDLARNGESESTRLQALAWLRDSGYTRPAERHELAMGARDDSDDDAELAQLDAVQLRALLAAEREYDDRRAAILAQPAQLALTDGSS